jgi:sugar phosphate isomerase/epimerase
MRLGTTSYIYPADIITNVRRLAGKVRDVELILFELDDGPNSLPDDNTISELKSLGAGHDMTYTVHLPLDLRLASERPAVSKAIRAIRNTERLLPHGYIVHLEGEEDLKEPDDLKRWTDNSIRSLEIICGEVMHSGQVCVENLENHSQLMLESVLDRMPVSCCVDVGHLWKQGVNPLPFLDRWLSRARVVHMHGVGDRDHKRLSLMSPMELDPVVEVLRERFQGVLTFEVFSERDFSDSLAAFQESSRRAAARSPHRR